MKVIEKMIVSAYEDGEVQSPWKEQVARRILEEEGWAAEAEHHRQLKSLIHAAPEPDFTEQRARVLSRIKAGSGQLRASKGLSIAWFSVAAALLVLALGGGFLWGRQSAASTASEVAELQVQVPLQLELKLSGEGQLLMASTLEGIGR